MANKLEKTLIEKAREFGATDLSVKIGGKHPKLCGVIGGTRFKYSFPGSPSDWRSGMNSLQALKRKLAARIAAH